MLLRSIGKSLRGKATPTQVFLATLLGGTLGFVPGFFLVGDLGGGFMQAPATILSLLFLVLVLNANLALFGLTLALSKLLAALLLPISFAVGQWLLDGPAQGLFQALINAPFFAWCGLEYYATTGGLLVGAIVGSVLGVVVVKLLRGFRKRMAALEEGSDRYKAYSQKGWVRFGTWVLFGKGKGKKLSYRELAEEQRRGLPIRIPGVVAVAVLGVLLWLGQGWLTGPGLRNTVRSGLEYWNRATVDLEQASLDLGGGQLVFGGLGMTDVEDLMRNAFQARTLDLQLGTADLLSKRFVIDRIVSTEAFTGSRREKPGEIVRPPETPPPPPPAEDGAWTLEGVMAEAEVWKQRLQQVSSWLEYLQGDGGAAPTDEEVREQGEVLGLARVAALHLLEEAPRVLVRELKFDGIVAVGLENELLDVRATNLSSNPSLVDEPLEISIVARSGAFEIKLSMNPAVDSVAQIQTTFRGLQVDEWMGELKQAPLRGGTIDINLAGALDLSRPEGVWLDLPLQFELHDTVLAIPGLQETKVSNLAVPIGLKGYLSAPAITLEQAALTDALVAAGKAELAAAVRQQAEALGLKVPGVGEALGGLLDGQKTPEEIAAELAAEARKQAEAEARSRAEAEAKNLLKGILGGKKKDG